MPPSTVRWAMSAHVALGLAVAASGAGALAIAGGPGRLTTYAGGSGLAAALTVATGIALGVAGLVAARGGAQRIGGLTLLAGLAWFAPVWVGWDDGPPLARSIGMIAAGFVVPLLVHAVLAYPGDGVHSRVGRALVVTAYVEAALVAVGSALFRDPFFDPYCWSNCTENTNVFLLRSFPEAARAIVVSDQWFTGAVAVALAAMCVWRLVTATPAARRVLLPVDTPAVVFASAVTAHALARLSLPLEDPTEPAFRGSFVLTCIALVLLAGGMAWGSLRTQLQRRAVSRIASSLGDAPSPGSLETALGRAVGDPDLRIAYWLPDSARYVDASGRAVAEPATGPGRVVTTLIRREQRVAVVSHAQGVPEISTEMGAAVRLALDNERLQAEGLAQLEELRASRTRIVETGDVERRRLERDLHDGAQQRLLAASYEIRLARSSAEAAGDAPTGSLLSEALQQTQAALDELRGLAHGLYPAILEQAGLAAALATLADTAPLVVETRGVTDGRYPAAVEIAAYLLVVEAVEDAVARNATFIAVSATRHHGDLVVALDGDGSERTTASVRSADRVGALGGSLEVGPMMLRAVIPCG